MELAENDRFIMNFDAKNWTSFWNYIILSFVNLRF